MAVIVTGIILAWLWWSERDKIFGALYLTGLVVMTLKYCVYLPIALGKTVEKDAG